VFFSKLGTACAIPDCVTHTSINRNISAGLFTWFSFDLFHHSRKENPDVWFALRYVTAVATAHSLTDPIFEVLTAVLINTQFFCDVTPCRFVSSYGRFERSYGIHPSGQTA